MASNQTFLWPEISVLRQLGRYVNVMNQYCAYIETKLFDKQLEMKYVQFVVRH